MRPECLGSPAGMAEECSPALSPGARCPQLGADLTEDMQVGPHRIPAHQRFGQSVHRLGALGRFEDIFDIVAAGFEPKPRMGPYRALVDRNNIVASRAAMIDAAQEEPWVIEQYEAPTG